MKVPLGWLRDYVALDAGTAEIVEKLAMLGFPVESVEQRPQCSNVVVGKLVKIEKHPNADRLQICTVDVGAERPLTILTAAPNVAQGQIVPVAKLGAQLVNLKIEPRKMRGIDSEGMLVSANELGFEADWFEDGILILEEDAPVGADFIELTRLNDDVIDVEITANRVDAMCLLGIARELSVAFKQPLHVPDTKIEHYSGDSSDVSVRLESPDCKHFVAQRVDGLRVRPAKAAMRLRLALAGQRPINNLVDISNFVMLELGQPTHAFDLAKLGGNAIVVRRATTGEKITTLDGTERTLRDSMIVIADASRPQAVAGVMGG
ncbi:MAG TPA: phenylalanine--tRNA ligase subunit beta, partial [Candidatus Acidoferrales bacterium]|nr:phenylalanine--tRNA ligase subunit beta [Candidatus Acidoferrales bacterium]